MLARGEPTPVRQALVAGGVCLLVVLPRVRVPAALLPLISTLAASSLFFYLTHWQVYPHLGVDVVRRLAVPDLTTAS